MSAEERAEPGSEPESGAHGTTSSTLGRALPAPNSDELVDPAEQARVFEALFGEPAPGEYLGRYVILGKLGRGGMGMVLEAFDRRLDRRVALKVLYRDLELKQRQRLEREARAMGKLSHPNVVQVFEVGDADGQAFIAMELVEGMSLREWMRRKPRPGWRECVDVFVQAGRGLAAAHASGLIHRDFKPDNALVGTDGRVRVADFGLARTLDSEPAENLDVTSERSGEGSLRSGSGTRKLAPLTKTGAILGTIAYMAPEQMRGRAVDARADQFSFCVALFEAVYGERPFDASSLMARVMMLEAGPEEPEAIASAPRWLYRVLLRGLAKTPEDRFESMDALLSVLSRRVARRRWALGGSLLACVVAGVGGAVAAQRSPCEPDESVLAGTWDDQRRDAVRRAFAATGLEVAQTSAQTLVEGLDRWSTDWVAGRRAACTATRAEGTQSEAVLDLRMGCLERQRREADAIIAVLEGADRSTVAEATTLLQRLPDPVACGDPRLAEITYPMPVDPEQREAVLQAFESLSGARALGMTRHLDQAERDIDAVADEVGASNYLPLRLEAQALQASMLIWRHEEDRAIPLLRELVREAEVAGLDDFVAWQRVDLAVAVVGRWGPPMAQQIVIEEAQTAVARVGRAADPRRVWLAFAAGELAAARGDYDVATARVRDGIELARSMGDLELRGQGHFRLAQVFVDLEDLSRATTEYELAREAFFEHRGQGSMADASIDADLGLVAMARGDFDAASDHLSRARRIYLELVDEHVPELLRVTNAQAKLALLDGDLDAAAHGFEHVAHAEPDPQTGADAWEGLGIVRYYQDDLRGSLDAYRQSLQLALEVLGPEHPRIGMLHSNIGESLTAMGEHDQAFEQYAKALSIFERALPPDHLDFAFPLKGRAESRLAQGSVDDAVDDLERARALLAASGAEPTELAAVESSLAKAKAKATSG